MAGAASSTGFSVRWAILFGLTFLTDHTSGALGGPKNWCAGPARIAGGGFLPFRRAADRGKMAAAIAHSALGSGVVTSMSIYEQASQVGSEILRDVPDIYPASRLRRAPHDLIPAGPSQLHGVRFAS